MCIRVRASYVRQLVKVGVKAILNILRRPQGGERGVILLCYEPAGEPCHRRQFASWIERKGGIMVPEYTAAAIGYCRISKAGDAKSVSIATQKAQIASYATSMGWRLASTVEDNGVSGGRRSRFARLDAAVKEHAALFVVCYSLDRLGRDAAGLLDWTASAARRGIQLHVCGRGLIETSSSSGFLGASVEAVVAQHYRIICSEKTRSALTHLRSAGRRWSCRAPYGARWTQDGGVEPDPAEQAIITRALALRTAGLSLRKVSAALTAEGLLGRAGRPLSAETVNSIVRANAVRASTGYLRH
jgi:DNA invertase Pin-like site-specific DNA recombinase